MNMKYKKDEKKDVCLEPTNLEWEVINQALGMPIRNELIAKMRELGISEKEATEKDIMKAWDKITDKWRETY